jgi:segregation and condensation protein A
MFAHHHVRREPLSVRERMSNILAALEHGSFVEFSRLFVPEEGRAGVTVSFIAILELMREGLIDITQTEAYAPLHVRAAAANRTLHLVADNSLPEPAASAALTAGDNADESSGADNGVLE